MFAKLLKYEWKASSGILGILSLAALGVGVLGAVILRLITGLEVAEGIGGILMAVLTMTLIFLLLAVVAYAFGAEILLLYRFYKSKFTDEGYLTFTLPVNSRQIFLASFLNIGAWTLIAGLVVAGAMGMMVFLGIDWETLAGPGGLKEIMIFYEEMYEVQDAAGQVWLSWLSGVISFVSGIVTMMTCVTVGAVIAKKHKVLAAFGIYYGVSMITGVLSSVISMAVILSAQEYAADTIALLEMGIQLALAVTGFFLSTYLMEKKLNLP